MRILSANPGGTSTKIGVFDDTQEILNTGLIYTAEDLAGFATVFDQLDYRKQLILQALVQADIPTESLDCVVGRGGASAGAGRRRLPGGRHHALRPAQCRPGRASGQLGGGHRKGDCRFGRKTILRG